MKMRVCRLSWLFWLAACLLPGTGNAQGLTLRAMVDTLASPAMAGRGAAGDGLARAADWMAGYMNSIGLDSLPGGRRQCFTHPVNLFDGRLALALNGRPLKPGRDFLIAPFSRGTGPVSGILQPLDSATLGDPRRGIFVEKVSRLTWGVATRQQPFILVQIADTAWPALPASYQLEAGARFDSAWQVCNLIGLIPGAERPDSFLLLTAHYDHLGMMGTEAVFRGANDNASGVALMLWLAEQIRQRPLRYSVLCMAFAGEEAGLLGSKHFVEHSPIPLDRIRFLVNLDLLGTGEAGLMAVNATRHPAEWTLLDSLNRILGAFTHIGQRGPAANSDHYWFAEAGVPAFFLYTMGGVDAYHDIYDLPETLPLSHTEAAGELILRFFHILSNTPSHEH